jgi:hypothetical protein
MVGLSFRMALRSPRIQFCVLLVPLPFPRRAGPHRLGGAYANVLYHTYQQESGEMFLACQSQVSSATLYASWRSER